MCFAGAVHPLEHRGGGSAGYTRRRMCMKGFGKKMKLTVWFRFYASMLFFYFCSANLKDPLHRLDISSGDVATHQCLPPPNERLGDRSSVGCYSRSAPLLLSMRSPTGPPPHHHLWGPPRTSSPPPHRSPLPPTIPRPGHSQCLPESTHPPLCVADWLVDVLDLGVKPSPALEEAGNPASSCR